MESYGLALDLIPLAHIGIAPRDEFPNIMLGTRDRDAEIDRVCEIIEATAAAGIPALKYYLSYLGIVSTGRVEGRGGSSNRSFVYEEAEQCPYCGWYVTQTTSTFAGKPFWFVLLGIAGIVAVISVLGGLL